METTNTQQEPEMHAEPQEEHRWLQRLVGEWTYEGEADMGPDKPAETFSGAETVRSLGDLWILAEGQGEGPSDNKDTWLLTLGYDADKGNYVGTWVGSMMTQLWVYHDAEFDASANTLALLSEGPDMEKKGETTLYKDVITVENDDRRKTTAYFQTEEGDWVQMMEMRFQRNK